MENDDIVTYEEFLDILREKKIIDKWSSLPMFEIHKLKDDVYLRMLATIDGVRIVACDKKGNILNNLLGIKKDGTVFFYENVDSHLGLNTDVRGRLNIEGVIDLGEPVKK